MAGKRRVPYICSGRILVKKVNKLNICLDYGYTVENLFSVFIEPNKEGPDGALLLLKSPCL